MLSASFYISLIHPNGRVFPLNFIFVSCENDGFTSMLERKNELDAALGDSSQNYAAQFGSLTFIPNKTLQVSSKSFNGVHKFFLNLNSVNFAEINENTDENPHIISLIERGAWNFMRSLLNYLFLDGFEQLPCLVVEIKSIPDHLKSKLELDLCFYVKSSNDTFSIKRLCLPSAEWVRIIHETYNRDKIFYIFDVRGDPNSLIKTHVSLKPSDAFKGTMFDVDSKTNISCMTSMHFQVELCEKNTYTFIEKVKMAFSAPLTEIGKRTMNRIKYKLQERRLQCSTYATRIFAPIVLLCQSSGSGKSKLAIELVNVNPGFYLTFGQEKNQFEFPVRNNLSIELETIIKEYNRLDISDDSNIFLILDFIFRSILFSMEHIFNFVQMNCPDNASDDTINDTLSKAISNFGSKFFLNQSSDLIIPSTEDSRMHYIRFLSKLSSNGKSIASVCVAEVSRSITGLLTSPAEFLSLDPDNDGLVTKISEILARNFNSFPFLYVVDEADLLATHQFDQLIAPGSSSHSRIVNGLEVFRRAISYIEPSAPIIFLTLGTKSDVSVLNPPVIDISARYPNRTKFLAPIVLTSNSNIFSLKFPIYKLEPKYGMLLNPLMMKFLTTLGHGLWGNYPFDSVVEMAKYKLVNGSQNQGTYLISIWLSRTGLTAKPAYPARKLVSNHMATLLSVSEDLKDLVVTYPSEPIISMACKQLTSEIDVSKEDILFAHLKDNLEWVSIDGGKYAETFAKMIVLLNIDKCPDSAHHTVDYKSNLDSIVTKCRAMRELWETKSFLLENTSDHRKEAYTAIGPECTRFLGYSVHTVGSFLQQWLRRDGIDCGVSVDSLGIPEFMLKSIINATHFVSLVKDSRGFSCESLNISPVSMPLADDRIVDVSRNVIDQSLLQIGLSRQCGFTMPDNYFGCDFIIPVCLPDDTYSFLAFQVKKSISGLQDDIFKLQARFHYVRCLSCPADRSKTCLNCRKPDELSQIFGNQISFLISLSQEDPSSIPKFRNSTEYYEGFNSEIVRNKTKLVNALSGPSPRTLSLTNSAKSKYLFYPLIHDRKRLMDDVLLSRALWYDPLTSCGGSCDRTVHRQFCFVSRGWGNLHGLIGKDDSSARNAKDILSGLVGPFKRQTQSPKCPADVIRSAIYDVGPTYMEYSEELISSRSKGNLSNLQIIDQATNCTNPDKRTRY
jgi:hypothetical protein